MISDMEIQDKTLTLVNIYAPNKDEPTFCQNVGEKLSSFDCDFIIFGCDYNLVYATYTKIKRAVFLLLIRSPEMK